VARLKTGTTRIHILTFYKAPELALALTQSLCLG